MIEQFGDAWQLSKGQFLCLTTNGFVKRNGEAVMGRGIAYQAAIKFPDLPKVLGIAIKQFGNNVVSLGKHGEWRLIAFPVKHKWFERADKELIVKSVESLARMYGDTEFHVFLPRPGCGNGQLNWDEVKPLVEILDDRFIVVTNDSNVR